MTTPITDLQSFVATHPWFACCKQFGFGLVLPSGWFGRPYDNAHHPNCFRVENRNLILIFDDEQRLVLEGPQEYELKQVGGIYTLMRLLGSNLVTLEHMHDPITPGSKTRSATFARPNSTDVELCGYFVLSSEHESSQT